MLNLPNLIGKGMQIAEDKPALHYHEWALDNLPEQERDWQGDLIHVSDYAVTINEQSDKKCPRQLWLRYNGADKREAKAGEEFMWDQGLALQYRSTYYIYLALPNDWYIYDIEHDLTGYLPYSDVGSADLVLGNDSMRKYIVVEVKTQRGKSFQYLDEPKPSHEKQLEGYLYGVNHELLDGSIQGNILYLDREGQNKPVQFEYEFTVLETKSYSEQAHIIVDEDKPSILNPIVSKRNNKGPDSLYVKQPWQCSYCKFQGISCEGALDKDLQGLGIVAHISNEPKLNMDLEDERLEKIIREQLDL